jgi:hypothetical protein
MQSMDILIVICGDNYRDSHDGGGKVHARVGAMPVRDSNRVGAQKSATGDKEKAAPRTQHTLHRFHGTEKQDGDYSSFLVFRTLRPR